MVPPFKLPFPPHSLYREAPFNCGFIVGRAVINPTPPVQDSNIEHFID